MDAAVNVPSQELHAREYQLEMLRHSLAENIIIAMDTGSGKTLVAILRIREELERTESNKIIWFLCPTVVLCEQQLRAIQRHVPSAPTRMLCGRDGVDTWSSREMWQEALRNIKIVVCTHQVLLDALTHGFIRIHDISILIFDEAHHCIKKHPACKIMTNFYHKTPMGDPAHLPKILGLTASPITRNNKESLKDIEQNLQAIAKTPKLAREELLQHVNRPVSSPLIFNPEQSPYPRLLVKLEELYLKMNILEDPYVKSLKNDDLTLYQETIANHKTYCHTNVKRFLNVAKNIHKEFGPFLTENYIVSVVSNMGRIVRDTDDSDFQNTSLSADERSYLYSTLKPLEVSDFSLIDEEYSFKLESLLQLLETEMTSVSTAIVFVETRSATKLLADLLSSCPRTKHKIRAGYFVGLSQFHKRAFQLSELVESWGQEKTLEDLRTGKLNLLVSTTVCEEGIDVSSCNLVVCFDPPKNIKSFIQRRGRARSVLSKLVLMCPDGNKSSLGDWIELEKEMIELYMDDTRQLQACQKTTDPRELARELLVAKTGAKLTLENAVQHIYHFCNKLPQIQHTKLAPIFLYDGIEDEITCRIQLPVTLHPSVQTFQSMQTWSTRKLARQDAAFEAYVGLYKFGLVNDHLLPYHSSIAETGGEYYNIPTREAKWPIKGQADPWISIASCWRRGNHLFQRRLDIEGLDEEHKISMLMIAPRQIPLPYQNSVLKHFEVSRDVSITFSEPTEIAVTYEFLKQARQMTWNILASVFRTKLDADKIGFPLLFVPFNLERHEFQSWLQNTAGAYPAVMLTTENYESLGLVRSQLHPHRMFRLRGTACTSSTEATPSLCLECIPFSKKPYTQHTSASTSSMRDTESILLDASMCNIDRLPIVYALFARHVPFFMYSCTTSLMVEELNTKILASAAFSTSKILIPAIVTPSAGQLTNYQRLEFLGDCILKALTSIHLMWMYPLWHEGLLSNRKDNIVSNARLAKAAEDVGLTPYIITTAFAQKRWRPTYIDDLLSQNPASDRSVSTKVMADVVEAIIGAAYIDGQFERALAVLGIMLPEVTWEPISTVVGAIQVAAIDQSSKVTATPQIHELEAILGYNFQHRCLLKEAITHPSYMSASSPVNSYQRLEFLGDALLDYIVTNTIYRFSEDMVVHRMHLLRTAAVNASFLAFCALSTTISLPIADLGYSGPSASALGQESTSDSEAERGAENSSRIFPTTSKRLSLPLYLRFSPNTALSASLTATRKRFEYLEPMISASLTSLGPYPWRLLAALNPEKVFSDLMESALAAIWIDSKGDFEECEAFLRKFGVLGWLESALRDGIKVWHPKEELGQCAGERKVNYKVWLNGVEQKSSLQDHTEARDRDVGRGSDAFERGDDTAEEVVEEALTKRLELNDGPWSCKVFVGEHEITVARGWNRLEVETAAADKAIGILKSTSTEALNSMHPYQVSDADRILEETSIASPKDEGKADELRSASRAKRSFNEYVQ